ncbi:MAG TPA: energy transducer TonB [Candidatus Solibacter sp.]
MKYRKLGVLVFVLCAGRAARADLTMRHTIDFKFGSFLPPSAVEAMKAQLGDQLPKEIVVLIKGKKNYTSMGAMVMIGDYDKGVITLLDQKGHRFATAPVAAFWEQIAAAQKLKMAVLPPQAQQMFDNMKFDVKTERTGKTAKIQGMNGEETLLTVAVEIPNPMGVSMQMRMEMRQWMASAEDVDRNPALKELEQHGELQKSGLDPTAMMTKSLATIPGMADKLRDAVRELTKNSGKAMLRMQTAVYMPQMAAISGGSADQPFTEFSMELAEFSGAPLPDSRFEVPVDYQSAPVEELIGQLFPAPKLPVPSGAPKAARVPPPPLPPGVVRVGNGVTAPSVIYKVDPSYTEEARAAKVQGTVVLNVVVGADGSAQQVSVLRSLDPGLDQKAVETVGTWKFRPGMKDGQPVAVMAQIEVNFRLM